MSRTGENVITIGSSHDEVSLNIGIMFLRKFLSIADPTSAGKADFVVDYIPEARSQNLSPAELEQVRRGLSQKGTEDLGTFSHYVD